MKRLSLILGTASLLLGASCGLPDLPALPDGGGSSASDSGVEDAMGGGGPDSPVQQGGNDSGADASVGADASFGSDAASDAMGDAALPDAGVGAVGILGAACLAPGALACAGNAQKLTIACSAGVWTSVATCPRGQNCDSTPGPNQGTCAAIDPSCTSAAPGGNACGSATAVVRCGPDLVSDTPVMTCTGQACVNGACTGGCTPGTTQCMGNGVQTCGSNGTWGTAVPCSNSTCSMGMCSGTCSAGAVQCSGTSAVQSCVSGMWGTPTPCTGQACVAGVCSGMCSPGTTECTSDTQMATCSAIGAWGAPTTCADACVGTLSTVPGSCGGVCVPGTSECASDTQLATCDVTGQWSIMTTCPDACVGAVNTVPGSCGGTCVPGTSECASDTQLLTCDMTGQWSIMTTCPFACLGAVTTVPGTCGGMCVPGTTQCMNNGVQTCGPAGTWGNPATCSGSTCSMGSCSGSCAPGAMQCSGNSPQTCVAGMWQTQSACASQACVNGLCQGSCAPNTTACHDDVTLETCDASGAWVLASSPCQYACVASAYDVAPGSCGGSCVPGQTECDSLTTQSTCTSAGAWGPATTCVNTTCVGSGPGTSCTGSCAQNQTECANATTQNNCTAMGTWGNPTTCSHETCVGSGVGSECAGSCSPGQQKCVSNNVTGCDASGNFTVNVMTCAASQTCVLNASTETAACTGSCGPGQQECSSNNVTGCDANGNYTVTVTSCGATSQTCGPTTSGAPGCLGTCAPGQKECSAANSVLGCDASGNYTVNVVTCSDQTCMQSGTTASCQGSCAPGQVECQGSAVATCSGGNWSTTSCSAPTPACVGGSCVQCAPGTSQCTGTTASQTCSSSGTWGTSVACSGTTAPYCSISSGTCGPPPNVIFVTTAVYGANLGGASGANSTCQSAANTAGLTGTFVAYLSTSTTPASSLIQSARGWVRTDGLPVADTAAELSAGSLWYPVLLDQRGVGVAASNSEVWTGTNYQGGLSSGNTCTDWTGTSATSYGATGIAFAGFSGWENFGSLGCSGQAHLYCLQVSQNVEVTVTKVAGRYAFVTPWSPGGGLSSANAACQTSATQANLPGTYSALLASSTASAASGFSTSGSTWVRPDGVPVFATATDLNTMTVLAPIVLNASGGYQGNYAVWNGATSVKLAGAAATTCNNWASNAADAGSPNAPSCVTGFTQISTGPAWGYQTLTCSATWGTVYCLQE